MFIFDYITRVKSFVTSKGITELKTKTGALAMHTLPFLFTVYLLNSYLFFYLYHLSAMHAVMHASALHIL